METLHTGRFVARLWRVVASLLVLMALLIGQSIYTSRSQHEEQAVVETYSVARVLESDLANLVDKVKLALHTVATEQERRLAARVPEEQATRAYIASIHANLPDVLELRVAGAEGRLVYQGEFANAPLPGIGGEPYFRELRDAHASGVLFSAPHRDGPDGPWVVELARRVEYPDGSFAGAVVAPVPVERLVSMLAAADIGPSGAVSLRGQDLELIARHPRCAKWSRGERSRPRSTRYPRSTAWTGSIPTGRWAATRCTSPSAGRARNTWGTGAATWAWSRRSRASSSPWRSARR